MINKEGVLAEFNDKIMPEQEFRMRVLKSCEKYGCRAEVQQIMDRYDQMLSRCTNQREREQIAIMGNAEIHKMMDCYGSLVINGKEIIPAEDPEKERQTIIYKGK